MQQDQYGAESLQVLVQNLVSVVDVESEVAEDGRHDHHPRLCVRNGVTYTLCVAGREGGREGGREREREKEGKREREREKDLSA